MNQTEEQNTNSLDIARIGKAIIWLAFLGYMVWNYWGKDFFSLPKCDSQESVQMAIKMNQEMYKEKFEVKGLTNIYETGFNEQGKMRFCRAVVEMVSLPDRFPFPVETKYTIEETNGKARLQLSPF